MSTFICQNVLSTHQKTAHGLFILAVIEYGHWEIWKARNKAKYDGRSMSNSRILHRIIYQVKSLCNIANLKEADNNKMKCLGDFGICTRAISNSQLRVIRWMQPLWPSLKLNTDGACKSNGESGGGGVIRDSRGNTIFAFSHFYGTANSLIAEARALLDGIKYLRTFVSDPAIVECDSQSLVRIIKKEIHCPWSILAYAREVWNVLSEKDNIGHVFREGNQVADSLASLACSSKCNSFFSLDELPITIKGIARLDKLGMPSIRTM